MYIHIYIPTWYCHCVVSPTSGNFEHLNAASILGVAEKGVSMMNMCAAYF